MKFCESHWTALRDEIENKRGLQQFVAGNGKEAFTRQVDALETGAASSGDPLMDAFWMITNNAINVAGPYLLADREDGSERCPLCEIFVTRKCPCESCANVTAQTWIEFAGRDVAAMWADRLKAALQ